LPQAKKYLELLKNHDYKKVIEILYPDAEKIWLDDTKITKCYRMICSINGLQKKDADQLVELFRIGGYSISKSRAMNLLSQDESMTVNELHSFLEGFKASQN
jgi:hypothetical protein